MKIVVLLGGPGSGKGTIATRLTASDASFRHVSSGDLLREALRLQTAAGREADGYMKRGELVPDALIAEMVRDLLMRDQQSGTLLLDGFPRTVCQAEMLEQTLSGSEATFGVAVLLDVEDTVLVDRIAGRRTCPACGAGYHVTNIPPRVAGVCDTCNTALVTRKDDNPETVKNRLAVYKAQTVPLIDFYEARGVLRRVVGMGPLDEITKRVKQAIQ